MLSTLKFLSRTSRLAYPLLVGSGRGAKKVRSLHTVNHHDHGDVQGPYLIKASDPTKMHEILKNNCLTRVLGLEAKLPIFVHNRMFQFMNNFLSGSNFGYGCLAFYTKERHQVTYDQPTGPDVTWSKETVSIVPAIVAENGMTKVVDLQLARDIQQQLQEAIEQMNPDDKAFYTEYNAQIFHSLEQDSGLIPATRLKP